MSSERLTRIWTFKQIPIYSNKLLLIKQIESDWQRNCSNKPWELNTIGGGEKVKNFDQWTEELSKQGFVQTDEDNMKIVYKAKEVFVEDDFEEEE